MVVDGRISVSLLVICAFFYFFRHQRNAPKLLPISDQPGLCQTSSTVKIFIWPRIYSSEIGLVGQQKLPVVASFQFGTGRNALQNCSHPQKRRCKKRSFKHLRRIRACSTVQYSCMYMHSNVCTAIFNLFSLVRLAWLAPPQTLDATVLYSTVLNKSGLVLYLAPRINQAYACV